jgi:hypothetical protein
MQRLMTFLQTESGDDLSRIRRRVCSRNTYAGRAVRECAGDKPLAALVHNIPLPFFVCF